MMEIEFKTNAYMPDFMSLEDITSGKHTPYLSDGDRRHCESLGYQKIGAAHVVLTIDPQDKILANHLAALQTQLQTVRAENQQRENAITDQISKLQAIAFTA